MPRRIPTALPVLLLLVAASAEAGFYRWRDAAGQEHYAQDLQQVPPAYRAEAKAAASAAGKPERLNVHHTHAPIATSGAISAEGASAPVPAARAPAFDCEDLKAQVKKKLKVVEIHERSVEANQRWADDIERSAFSRRKYELRADEEERWLAKAEADLDRFRDEQRRAGVPPGCLREP